MQYGNKELITKKYYSTDYRLEFAYMKKEFRVIVNHHVTVKSNLTEVLTARHGPKEMGQRSDKSIES